MADDLLGFDIPEQEEAADNFAAEHDSCPAISAMGPDAYAPEILRQRICLMALESHVRMLEEVLRDIRALADQFEEWLAEDQPDAMVAWLQRMMGVLQQESNNYQQ
mgnify:CR=1 FL=1